jgi:hypothetical protein
MRIRIQLFTLMRIHADPDTQPYFLHKVLEDDVTVGPGSRKHSAGRDDFKL